MPSLEEMLSSANDEVPKVTAEEAHELISGRDALLVDVRDAQEIGVLGMLKGAVNVSRGMLEFRAAPYGSNHNPEFRAERPVVLYCASGGRAALAGKTLREMGYGEVYNLGGFKQAVNSGFPTECE